MQIENMLGDLTGNCKLLLVVGKPGSGKSKVLTEFSNKNGIPVLDLNTVISDNTDPKKLTNLVEGFLHNYKYKVVLIDKKEILYNHSSSVDVLDFLVNISKKVPVIATWNGYLENNELHHIRKDKEFIYNISDNFKCVEL